MRKHRKMDVVGTTNLSAFMPLSMSSGFTLVAGLRSPCAKQQVVVM